MDSKFIEKKKKQQQKQMKKNIQEINTKILEPTKRWININISTISTTSTIINEWIVYWIIRLLLIY